jgi:hypothetical protein
LIILITIWWFVSGKGTYQGPKYFKEAAEALQHGLSAAEKAGPESS